MKIGLVPISAKPYHAGHHALVTSAANENDKVILFVSTSNRERPGEFPIMGSDMMEVWEKFLEPVLPSNVTVEYGGSPVRKVYEALGEANEVEDDSIYTVYSDPEDTSKNYSEKSLHKYCSQLRSSGQCILAAEANPEAFTRGVGTPDISGTKVRQMLSNRDFKSFAAVMPVGVNAKGVFEILTKHINEAYLRQYIQSIICD